MKIGILQTGHSPEDFREQLGDYGEMFTKLLDGHDFDFQIWSVVDGILPERVDEADGWLITGSKHGAYEDHDWIPLLEDFIRETYADGRPMIGVCFGHQVIAQALGGKVEKFTGGWSIGRTEYDMDGDKLALNAWHQDQVVELPEGAKVVASSDFCPYAALAYDNRIWTVQPHPEFGHDFIDGLIKTRGKGVVPDHQLEQATAALGGPIDNQKIADQMAAFFKDNRKERA
ncbi:MAG: type 1 glutamine amidotransferase [Sulfitobacter sp.]